MWCLDVHRRGEAFIVTDYRSEFWEHFEPFLEARGLVAPRSSIPLWVGKIAAEFAEVYYKLVFYTFDVRLPVKLTRYSVRSAGAHYYSKTTKVSGSHLGLSMCALCCVSR